MTVTTVHRGVTYAANVLQDGTIELMANGTLVGRGLLSVKIGGYGPPLPLLGGSEPDADTVYAALEAALVAVLVRLQ